MATKKPKGLGLGLEALLGPKVSDAEIAAARDGEPSSLRLEQLQPGKYQPGAKRFQEKIVLQDFIRLITN